MMKRRQSRSGSDWRRQAVPRSWIPDAATGKARSWMDRTQHHLRCVTVLFSTVLSTLDRAQLTNNSASLICTSYVILYNRGCSIMKAGYKRTSQEENWNLLIQVIHAVSIILLWTLEISVVLLVGDDNGSINSDVVSVAVKLTLLRQVLATCTPQHREPSTVNTGRQADTASSGPRDLYTAAPRAVHSKYWTDWSLHCCCQRWELSSDKTLRICLYSQMILHTLLSSETFPILLLDCTSNNSMLPEPV